MYHECRVVNGPRVIYDWPAIGVCVQPNAWYLRYDNLTIKQMNPRNAMQDLYSRLRKIGFDSDFLRRAVLPDWWEDSLATVASNRALAEAAVARHLGLQLSQLRDTRAALTAPTLTNARLKKNKNVQPAEVAPAMLVAQHAAELAAKNLSDLPEFSGRLSATEVRKAVLKSHAHADLASLLNFCWAHGIAVIHLKVLPQASKNLDGMALFCGKTPVIVLASSKDSPPWLAFHLAHELGHILLGHVKEGMGPWVDGSIDSITDDQHEREADEFACELLTGQKRFGFKPAFGMTAPKLAGRVQVYGERHGISLGVVTLFYGRSANRWGPAQLALKRLGQHEGAHEMINHALAVHLNREDLSESSARFLSILSEAA